jgi:hypothetical protein
VRTRSKIRILILMGSRMGASAVDLRRVTQLVVSGTVELANHPVPISVIRTNSDLFITLF